jgi:probable HAF family extracellular repeat protein
MRNIRKGLANGAVALKEVVFAVSSVLVVGACAENVQAPVDEPETFASAVLPDLSTTGVPIEVIQALDGCVPTAISNTGAIVGACGPSPFVWHRDRGRSDFDFDGIAYDINTRGDVIGRRLTVPAAQEWFLKTANGLEILPGLAFALNDSGTVVGFDSVETFRWTRSTGRVQPPHPRCFPSQPCLAYDGVSPRDINNAGFAAVDLVALVPLHNRVGIWLPYDGVLDLSSKGAPAAEHMNLFGINEANEILGMVVDAATDSSYLFVWSSKRGTSTIAPGVHRRWPGGINDRGAVAGTYRRQDSRLMAFVWTREGIMDLGTAGGWHSQAMAINDNGQVVGITFDQAGVRHVAVWRAHR